MLSLRSQDIPDIVVTAVIVVDKNTVGDVTEITIYPKAPAVVVVVDVVAPEAPDIIGCVQLDCPFWHSNWFKTQSASQSFFDSMNPISSLNWLEELIKLIFRWLLGITENYKIFDFFSQILFEGLTRRRWLYLRIY